MTHHTLRPTTFINNDSTPNPYYNKVEATYTSIGDAFLEDVTSAIDKLRADGIEDETAIMRDLMERFGDRLDELIDLFESTPENIQPLPPAPSPVSLYTRVEQVPVLDIGSGNCAKLSTCQTKVVATDKVPVENNHYIVKELDFEGPDFEVQRDLLCADGYKVVTSFNSISNAKNVEGVYNCDGIHVYPDIDHFKKHHGVEEIEGGVQVGPYRDYYNQVTMRGDVVAPGYKAVSTYAQAKYRFEPTGYTSGEGFAPMINSLHYTKESQSSPKYDGVAMMLNSGKAPSLRVRSGLIVNLKDVSSSPEKFTVMLEKLPKTGPAEAYVLLRVLQYKGWVPFHGLDNLHMFCERVKIKIAGVQVRAPGHHMLSQFPTDGVIFRDNQQDYRYKDVMTVDLFDPGAVVDELRNSYGLDIGVGPYPIDDQIKEFSLRCVSTGRYNFDYICHRRDKTHGDSLHKILEMLK